MVLDSFRNNTLNLTHQTQTMYNRSNLAKGAELNNFTPPMGDYCHAQWAKANQVEQVGQTT